MQPKLQVRMSSDLHQPLALLVGYPSLPHRLTLVTPSLPHVLPSKLVAMVTVVLFWPGPEGLEGLLLDQFLWKQNPKTSQERDQLRAVRSVDRQTDRKL